MQTNYFTALAIGIRRQAFPQKRSRDVSIVALLDEMIRTPEEYRRDDFLGYYVPLGMREEMNVRFDDFAGEGGEYLCRRMLGADRSAFVKKAERIVQFADALAHLSDGEGQSASYNDLDNALDALEVLVEKYQLLFGNRGRILDREITVLPGNWRDAFGHPWATKHARHFVATHLGKNSRAEKITRR